VKEFLRCKKGTDLLYHHAEYGGAWTFAFYRGLGRGTKSSEFFVLNGRVYANDFTIKALQYENDFDTLGRGRFVVVHVHSTLSLYL